MLLDGHDLDGVVAEVPDPRQHVILELEVRVHLWLLTRHADVALVDPQVAWLLRPVVLELVLLVGLVHPRLARSLGLVIAPVELHLVPGLRGPLDPRRDALAPLARLGLEAALHPGPVLDRALALLGVREEELPDPKRVLKCPVLRLWIPVVEVAHEGERLGARRPLPVPDALLSLVLPSVETKLLVPLGERVQAPLVLVDGVPKTPVPPVPLLDVVGVGPERGVEPEALGSVPLRDRRGPVYLLHGVTVRLDLSRRPLGLRVIGGWCRDGCLDLLGLLEGHARGIQLALELRDGPVGGLDRLSEELVLLLQQIQGGNLRLLGLRPAPPRRPAEPGTATLRQPRGGGHPARSKLPSTAHPVVPRSCYGMNDSKRPTLPGRVESRTLDL
mmetsp:Transcript_7024/g.24183  ORF Transcript_7024/g.24183 Transcript_7024/m.24183 type:complete len:388 (+) Transcript_7024:1529-2692(+)